MFPNVLAQEMIPACNTKACLSRCPIFSVKGKKKKDYPRKIFKKTIGSENLALWKDLLQENRKIVNTEERDLLIMEF